MLSFLKDIGIDAPPLVELVPERCLRRRLNSCECRSCLDNCAAGALSLVDRHVRLDLEKCTGCMRCIAVCPNEALVGSCDPEEVLRLVRARAPKRTVLSCIRQKQLATEEIAVPCLAVFAVESLVALGMSGCSSIVFHLADCPACENRQAVDQFLAEWRRVQHVAAKLFPTELFVAEDMERHTACETADRRSFLSSLGARLAAITRRREELRPTRQPKTTGKRVPVRVRIIDHIMAAAGGELRDRLLALCSHRITVGPSCNRCPRCTGICPTGALRINGTGAEKQLVFAGARCSGCGLCVAFCKKAALSLSSSPLATPSFKVRALPP